MKWIFILLLLANVLYFGWEIDRQTRIDTINLTAAREISPHLRQLTLLSEDDPRQQRLETPVLMDPADIERQDQTLSGSGINADRPVDDESAAKLVAVLPDFSLSNTDPGSRVPTCFTFGPVPEEPLAVGLEDWFKSRRVTTNRRFTDEYGQQLFWMYLAPTKSRNGALETIQDLKNKGVSDYRIIGRGSLENAVSLGIFSTQAALNNRLGELTQKGYKPVVVPYSDGKRVYWIDVLLNVGPDILDTVFKGYPSRYNYIPVDCSRIAIVMPNS